MSQPTPFFGNIDLRNNEIVRAVFENRTSHPTTTKGGRIYYNITEKAAFCYVGDDTWVDITKLYEHPKYQALNPKLSGAHVLAKLVISDEGHVVETETRLLKLSDLGFIGDPTANNYTHPTFNISGTGALNGATIISNINVNEEGHITGMATREMVASDIGAAMINDSVTDQLTTWSGAKIHSTLEQVGNNLTEVMRYMGYYDITSNTPNITMHSTKKGHCYVVTGGNGSFLGEMVANGSMLIATIDSPQTFSDWVNIGQRLADIESATEDRMGIIRLATDQEVIDESPVIAAVRPDQLGLWFESSEMNEFFDPLTTYLTARGIAPPKFETFTVVSQPKVVEVGTTLSGVRTFQWLTVVHDNSEPTIDVYDITMGSPLISASPDVGERTQAITTTLLNLSGQKQSWMGVINSVNESKVNSVPFSVTAYYQRYHGAVASLPSSNTDGTTNRTYANTLNKTFHTEEPNTFNLETGTTLKTFVVLLPPTKSITSVMDITNGGIDITNEYVRTTVTIKDVGGTNRAYSMFTMTVDETYHTTTIHEIKTN